MSNLGQCAVVELAEQQPFYSNLMQVMKGPADEADRIKAAAHRLRVKNLRGGYSPTGTLSTAIIHSTFSALQHTWMLRRLEV